jgi:hypothetical protein
MMRSSRDEFYVGGVIVLRKEKKMIEERFEPIC